MPVQYPANLRPMIAASKTRTQPAAFRLNAPRRGMPFAEKNGTTPPAFYDGVFRFTRCEAISFQLWFVIELQRGTLEATLPVKTEFGVQLLDGLLLPETLLPAQEQGEVWEYRCTFMARQLYLP